MNRAELDRNAIARMLDESIGDFDHLRCGAIVHSELHDSAFSSLLPAVFDEALDAIRRCAAPFVDRLIAITHRQHVVFFAGEQFDDLVLSAVCVLKFIDLDEAKSILKLRAHVVMLAQQTHGL